MVILHRVQGSDPSGLLLGLEPDHIEALTAQRNVFVGIEGFGRGTSTLTGFDEPTRVTTLKISSGLSTLLGVAPVLGRTFTGREVAGNGDLVLLISETLWRERFGSRPDVLGQGLDRDGERWTVIGVMPRSAVRPDGNPQASRLMASASRCRSAQNFRSTLSLANWQPTDQNTENFRNFLGFA